MRPGRLRLDKWLWFARFARTRTLAAKLVGDGHVRLDGRRIEDPAQAVKPGDVLTLALPRDTLVIRVVALGERRGPYPEARLLYETISGTAPPADAVAGTDGES